MRLEERRAAHRTRGRLFGLGGEIMGPLAEQLAANSRLYRAECRAADAATAAALPPGAAAKTVSVAKRGGAAQPRGLMGPAEFVRWDAARLPLRASTVDVAVVDLPFGVRCGNTELNKKLYPAALAELARVLRPAQRVGCAKQSAGDGDDGSGGRLVLMTLARRLLFQSVVAAARYWRAAEMHEANVGGLVVVVLVLRRTAAPPPADASERGMGGFLAHAGGGSRKWTGGGGFAEWTAGDGGDDDRSPLCHTLGAVA